MKSLTTMNLIDFVSKTALRVPLLARTKEEVFSELVDVLVLGDREGAKLRQEILGSVLEREESLSTSIGHGIAMPHGHAEIAERVVAAMGISRTPIPYDAIDGVPVRIFVLVVSRPGDDEGHLEALRAVSLFLAEDRIRDLIMECREPGALWSVLTSF